MRFGDGCATVKGDKFPIGHWQHAGKAEARFGTLSQDTGCFALVRAPRAHFSVKEKDEASRNASAYSGSVRVVFQQPSFSIWWD